MSSEKPSKSKNIADIAVLIVIFVASIAVIVLVGNRSKARALLESQPRALCTKGHFRLYFNQTHRCYIEGKQGPCGHLMILQGVGSYNNQSDKIGECKCQTFGQTGCDSRPTVYWHATNRCYFLFDQGPCRHGRWLIVDKFNNPKCVTIPCPSEYSAHKHIRDSSDINPDARFLFSSNSQCNVTLTQGFCPNGELVHFTSDSFQPQCRKASQGCSSSYSSPIELEIIKSVNTTELEIVESNNTIILLTDNKINKQ